VEADGYGLEHAYRFSYHWFGPARWFVRDTLASWFGPDGPLLIHRPGVQRYPALTLLVALDVFAAGLLAFLSLRAWWVRRRGARAGDAAPPIGGSASV
jgi:hypothetical protein